MLLASLAMLLNGCASSGHATEPEPEPQIVVRTVVKDTGCDWTKPLYVDKADVLSDATAKAILAHNETGAKKCGWKPKAP